MKYTLLELAEAVAGKAYGEEASLFVTGVSIDSRTVRTGSLFVPIKGTNRDGHDYIEAAISKGATITLTEDAGKVPEGCPFVLVDSTTIALGKLAGHYRRRWGKTVLAVTGSNGKTTTKEILKSIMSQKYKTHCNEGNLNNHLGVPLTLLNMEDETEICILEMGMDHQGEIEYLTHIGLPDYAAIVQTGMTHIENLGSEEAIAMAKLEILKSMDATKVFIYNADGEVLNQVMGNTSISPKKVAFGIQKGQYRGKLLSEDEKGFDFTVTYEGGVDCYRLNLIGSYNIYNALCAITFGYLFGIRAKDIQKALLEVKLPGKRMELMKGLLSTTILNDCYNASPDSMKAALDYIKLKKAKRKIAVLGDMVDMGEYANKTHATVGKLLHESGVDYLLAMGSKKEHYALGAMMGGMDNKNIYLADCMDDLIRQLKTWIKEEDLILIKASRFMNFEVIAESLKES